MSSAASPSSSPFTSSAAAKSRRKRPHSALAAALAHPAPSVWLTRSLAQPTPWGDSLYTPGHLVFSSRARGEDHLRREMLSELYRRADREHDQRVRDDSAAVEPSSPIQRSRWIDGGECAECERRSTNGEDSIEMEVSLGTASELAARHQLPRLLPAVELNSYAVADELKRFSAIPYHPNTVIEVHVDAKLEPANRAVDPLWIILQMSLVDLRVARGQGDVPLVLVDLIYQMQRAMPDNEPMRQSKLTFAPQPASALHTLAALAF